jgi:hypothetical protein
MALEAFPMRGRGVWEKETEGIDFSGGAALSGARREQAAQAA